MIEFIEKPEILYTNPFIGGRLIPIFFRKDGREHFAFNRYVTKDYYSNQQYEQWKRELALRDGTYLRYNGFYEDPLDMLDEMAERNHHFEDLKNLLIDDGDSVQFDGNREEVSAAFSYRIYDRELARKIETVVSLLNKGAWDEAKEEIGKGRT